MSNCSSSLRVTCCVIGCILLATSLADASTARPGARDLLRQQTHPTAAKVKLRTPIWRPERLNEGPVRIEVLLNQQVARLFAGSSLVGETSISSGREGYETPAGEYKITSKSRHHVSNLYGSYVDASSGRFVAEGTASGRPPSGTRYQAAPMPYFLRLTDCGVGLHSGFVNGRPISRGCMRLPDDMAAKFFAASPVGTPVIIR